MLWLLGLLIVAADGGAAACPTNAVTRAHAGQAVLVCYAAYLCAAIVQCCWQDTLRHNMLPTPVLVVLPGGFHVAAGPLADAVASVAGASAHWLPPGIDGLLSAPLPAWCSCSGLLACLMSHVIQRAGCDAPSPRLPAAH